MLDHMAAVVAAVVVLAISDHRQARLAWGNRALSD
jgi:hypothetical protein